MQDLMTVKVVARTMEAEGVVALMLAGAGGGDLPPFSAGAHIDVALGEGLVRQYSLCNDPAQSGRYEIAVLNDPAGRGGSAAVHRLAVGQDVRISAPRNHFELAAGPAPSLLFAGGIGVTPILCMAQRLWSAGRDFALHYSARSRRHCAFHDRITGSGFAARAHFHFDDGDASQRLDVGQVLADAAPDAHLYVCGPPGYIEAVLAAAAARGWPEEQVHREFFKAGPAASSQADGGFQVRLASTGQVLTVGAGASVLSVLRAAGIDLPSSCEQGVCGACLTRVLEGAPDHRDYYLTAQEQARSDCFTPCCSRALTLTLVLDL